MPDDRDVLGPETGPGLLGNTYVGEAAATEVAVSRSIDHHGPDEPLAEKKLGVLFWIAVGWVALVALAAIFANVLPLHSPTYEDFTAINARPSAQFLLGTDDNGRDLLSRLIFGARVSLVIGFVSVAVGLAIGGTLGLISGYRGGKLDSFLNAASFVVLAFPLIVALIAIISFWTPPTLFKITVILAAGTIPLFYRVVLATTLAFANRDFVIAARTLGATNRRIIFREILPNVVPAAISFALITVAIVIVLEGTLAFLGLSVSLPTPSWGNMIYQGTTNGDLTTNPYIMLWPALAMFLLLLAINIIGDRVRQRFDIREGLL